MKKVIKKVVLSALSVLGCSFLIWIVLIFNPSLSYAHETKVDFVTIYHNENLEEETISVLNKAIEIIKSSELYNDKYRIDLCLNDDRIYPNLHPLIGEPLGFAMFNKTVMKNCKVHFGKNSAETNWAINNHEHRKFNLDWLLAHEFMHNLQYLANTKYYISSTLGKINWKLEGHAEYVSRRFENDKDLKTKVLNFMIEEKKVHNGLPVFELEDGTKQILSYYKYALIIQYLKQEKYLTYNDICTLDTNMNSLYEELKNWATK